MGWFKSAGKCDNASQFKTTWVCSSVPVTILPTALSTAVWKIILYNDKGNKIKSQKFKSHNKNYILELYPLCGLIMGQGEAQLMNQWPSKNILQIMIINNRNFVPLLKL